MGASPRDAPMRVEVFFIVAGETTNEVDFPEATGGALEVSDILLTYARIFPMPHHPRIVILEKDHAGLDRPFDVLAPIWTRPD